MRLGGFDTKAPKQQSVVSIHNWTELNWIGWNTILDFFPMLNTVWLYTKILEAMINNKI